MTPEKLEQISNILNELSPEYKKIWNMAINEAVKEINKTSHILLPLAARVEMLKVK